MLFSQLHIGYQRVQDRLLDRAIDIGRMSAGLELDSVKVDGLDFAFLRGGAEDGETIFMVHGFGTNKDSWLLLARQLSDTYRIIAVDLPGHGGSSGGEGLDYLIFTQAHRLKRFLDSTGEEQVHFMGCSMGGAIGLTFAYLYPEKLKSLVLLDSAGVESPTPSEFFQLLEQGKNPLIVRKPGDLKVLTDFIMSKPPFMPWPLTSAQERQMIRREALNDKIFEDMMKSREMMGSPQRMGKLLESISTPTLAIWGEEDRVIDVSSIDVMAEHIPNFTSRVFPGVGHVPIMEIPEQVAESFRDFESSLDTLESGKKNGTPD